MQLATKTTARKRERRVEDGKIYGMELGREWTDGRTDGCESSDRVRVKYRLFGETQPSYAASHHKKPKG